METVKLHLWGKLIHSGHHDNYDDLPDIPLLTGHGKKKSSKEGVADVIAGAASAIVNNNPPYRIRKKFRVIIFRGISKN